MKLFFKDYTKTHKIYNLLGIKIKFRLSRDELYHRHTKKGNKFILHKQTGEIVENPKIRGLNVSFENCSNNTVEIWEPCKFQNTHIFFGNNNNNLIQIKATKYSFINSSFSICDKSEKCKLLIDENVAINGAGIDFNQNKDYTVKIGKHCLLAAGLKIMPIDYHTIFDVCTKKVINKEKTGITLGDHVWAATNVTILKDVTIPNNTIIAMNSTVTKSFEKENTLIGGTPAKILKENVNWDIRSIQEYCEETGIMSV